MTKLAKIISFSLSVICISSCFRNPPLAEPKITPEFDPMMGKVAAAYPEKKYILIEQFTRFDLKEDMIFYSRSTDEQAHFIKLTGQKLGQFWVADIDKGTFNIGDPVFMRHLKSDIPDSADINP